MKSPKIVLALAALVTTAAVTGPAAAADWAHRHPRQAEVIGRAHHQMHRVNAESREGELTRAQAHALKAGDRAIIRETRADARANGGYITRGQQARLNAQENAQSRAIGH